MDIFEISKQPTSIENIHQSAYRDSWLLNYALKLLAAGTPGAVVVDLVTQIRRFPNVDVKLSEVGKDVKP